MPAPEEIAWLAGWLEGEGSFGIKTDSRSPGYSTIYAGGGCKDKDIVEKAAKILGGTSSICYSGVCWRIDVYGDLAAHWMKILLPLMGKRRSSKIMETLSFWENKPTRRERAVERNKDKIGTRCKRGHLIIDDNILIETRPSGLRQIKCKICRSLRGNRIQSLRTFRSLIEKQEQYAEQENSEQLN